MIKIQTKKLAVNKKLYNKLKNICNLSNILMEFQNGILFKVKDTSIGFLEPHRFYVKINDIVLVFLCYDNLHLHFYHKDWIITFSEIRKIIAELKLEVRKSA